MGRKNKGWASWVHHARLLEFCTDYNGRLEVIQKDKPQSEIPGRLAAFQWWRGEIPKKIIKAWAASKKARAASENARAASENARAAFEKAWAAFEKAWAASKKARAASENARAASENARAASKKARAASLKARAASEKAWASYEKTYIDYYPILVKQFKKAHPEIEFDEEKEILKL